MAKITDFSQLRVYVFASQGALEIYRLTKLFPREELYSLTDQIRRSSRSVPANIAEAWRKRQYPAAFCAKLSDASAEANETLVWLEQAYGCGYMSTEERAKFDSQYRILLAQLNRMMMHPEQWTPKTKTASLLTPPSSLS